MNFFPGHPLAWAVLLIACSGTPAIGQTGVKTAPKAPPVYGGDHEFGFISGLSPHGGPIWGYQQNVRYSPTVLRYSYLVLERPKWTIRYSPEVTALAVMHENSKSIVNPNAPVTHFGAGVSPEGFQMTFRPRQRVQPFLSNDGGFVYYADRVLSPQGSQFMYTIDFGAGLDLFTSPHNALTMGFRYQHLSNANISEHNPGTDAQTFYLGFSHFHTHGQ